MVGGQGARSGKRRGGRVAGVDQRSAPRFTIKPMDLAESAAYLKHHLTLAGRGEPLFADDAIARLHRVPSGLPRALNNTPPPPLIPPPPPPTHPLAHPPPHKPTPTPTHA